MDCDLLLNDYFLHEYFKIRAQINKTIWKKFRS